jgi:DNA-binding LacI/PurR family transcriptional regulator
MSSSDPTPVEVAPGRRSSIGDVAREAGVSKQTVSNVLNGRSGYTEATKQRVLRAMADLAYRPRQAARTMRSHRTMQLGYHMTEAQLQTRSGFTMTFLQALVREAKLQDHNVLVFTDGEADPLGPLADLIDSGNVDFVVLSDLHVDDPRPELLVERRMPFACFGRLASHLPRTWVDVDNVSAMATIVDHLVDKGHRQIGYVGTDDAEYWTQERAEGFRSAMARHGLEVPDELVLTADRDRARGQVRDLLASTARPTAIACGTDALGADVINVAHAVGLAVPDELAVTGFAGAPMAQVTYPVLTSMRIPVERVARTVIAMCLDQLAGRPGPGEGTFLDTELVLGGSG